MRKLWVGHAFDETEMAQLSHAASDFVIVRPRQTLASNLSVAPSDPELATCEIAYGQPQVEDVFSSPSLRWVALSSAGYTRFDRGDLRSTAHARGLKITNASSVYSEPCAQHVLAMMLAHCRQLNEAAFSQFTDHSWNYASIRNQSLLLDATTTVLVIGYGAIARRSAELLAPFGVNIIAFRRSVRGDELVKTCPIDQIDDHLPTADHVVNVLPASDETRNFFNAKRLYLFKRGAVFYNIGRGDTVDQNALQTSLRDQQISAAWLDVTTPEPLPPDHPLWTAYGCRITPHTAGGFKGERRRQLEHFLTNLQRYLRDEPLVDLVIS